MFRYWAAFLAPLRFSHVMPSTAPSPRRDVHEEFVNAVTHGAGVVLSGAGAVVLLSNRPHWTVALACGL